MNNLNNPAAMSDAAFQQVQSQLIMQQRDQQLTVEHRRDWEAQHLAVFVDPPPAVLTAIRARQAAIQREQQRLEQLAKDSYTTSMEALKRRYRERRDLTGLEYDARQRALHNEWQARRVDLARRYVFTFADQRLRDIREQAYTASRAADVAVWEQESGPLIESYALPEPPAWASEPAHGVEDDDGPAPVRRQSRAAR